MTRILFVHEENKNNDFIQQFLSSVSRRISVAVLAILSSTQAAYALLYQQRHKDTFFTCIYALVWKQTAHRRSTADTEERIWRDRGEELLNKVVIFVFFVYKKYSRRFITLQLNHWWQMDYYDDAFHTFLDLDTVIYLAVYGTVSSLPVFIQNILNCVLKANKAFTGSEQHGGK